MPNLLLIKGVLTIGTSKPAKKMVTVLISIITLIILLIFCAISSFLSIFTGSRTIHSDFDAKTTEIYQSVRAVYSEYLGDLRTEMNQLEEEYEAANMTYRIEEIYNEETKEYEEKQIWYCKAQITKEVEYIQTAYVMAYLSVKHKDMYLKDSSSIQIEKEEVFTFWDTVCGIEVDKGGTKENPSYYIHNPVMSVEEIASTFFLTAAMQEEYLKSVSFISQFIGIENFGLNPSISTGNYGGMGIPLYYQYAEPWGSMAYGGRTIAKNGCAPTCIAMVFSYLKGTSILPSDIVNFTGNKYYVKDVGSDWSIFAACAKQWNLDCNSIGTSKSAVENALLNGRPVILSMRPGRFTASGHFIVLTGIDEMGMVTVNDPNDSNKKNFYNQTFEITDILSEAKAGWSFG